MKHAVPKSSPSLAMCLSLACLAGALLLPGRGHAQASQVGAEASSPTPLTLPPPSKTERVIIAAPPPASGAAKGEGFTPRASPLLTMHAKQRRGRAPDAIDPLLTRTYRRPAAPRPRFQSWSCGYPTYYGSYYANPYGPGVYGYGPYGRRGLGLGLALGLGIGAAARGGLHTHHGHGWGHHHH